MTHQKIKKVHIGPRSIEWWETKEDTPCQGSFIEDIYQMPYEDEYSQLTPYEDHTC
ncbi:hypothetical protein SAMN05446037_100526 [Anaerovirgula multivorans]|uniref:Uncharacterized protein n=1 Tax=Anaerovirgula multivorans TaxID=312168 RepID=A0A239C7E6_9FIRM|nr:hypothetical protein SAMN05446037_100526 [Anaerovirgula multivorans]